MAEGKPRNKTAGVALVFIGLIVGFMGFDALPQGSVAGGPIIWIALFGGCLLFMGVGFYLVFKVD